MLTPKSRARVRMEGAAEIAYQIPATAAYSALKLGQGMAGAVVAFDAAAGVLVERLGAMHDEAGLNFKPAADQFAIPDWRKVAAMAGEEFTADRFRELIEQSRRTLGFSGQTFLGIATEGA